MEKENKFKIVIPSYNNAEWVEPNLASILNQTYTNYEVLYIDDASTDNTFELVDAIVGDNPLFTIRRNPENMRRGYNTSPKVLKEFFDDDEDILVYVDGDDWLAYPDTLERLNKYYNEKDPWMTYGQMVVWKGGDEYSWPFPQNSHYPDVVHQNNSYRKDLWRASHLRTFKWHLYKKIQENSLKYTLTQKYYLHAEDLAGSFPCLEMCPAEKIGVLDFVTYTFNESKSNQIRSQNRIKEAGQTKTHSGITKMEIEIRNQSPYNKIQ
jgi:glycosyltransferase involved in cell wall biosynthesis